MVQTGVEFKTEPLSLSEVNHLEVLDEVWNKLLPCIEKGLSHGAGDTTTSSELYESLKNGISKMWVIHGLELVACVIISIKLYPNKKTVYVELLAGRDLDSFIYLIQDKLREFKELVKADTIEASCRAGLAKRLVDWNTKAYLMELP
jgi:hypothetical protein